MAESRIVERLRGAGWCVLVPCAIVAIYLAAGAGAVRLVSDPIIGTAVLGCLLAALIGTTRLVRPGWFAYAPPRQPDATPRSGWLVLGCTVLAFVAGQSMGLWVYATTGSDGFDQSIQARHAAGVEATALLTLVSAPAGEEALLRGLVYPLLRRRVGILASTLVTATTFGALHGNVVQLTSTLPLAVVLALVYERTRALVPCMLLHLAFNLAVTITPVQWLAPLATPPLVTLACLAFAGAAWTLYYQVRSAQRPPGEQSTREQAAGPCHP